MRLVPDYPDASREYQTRLSYERAALEVTIARIEIAVGGQNERKLAGGDVGWVLCDNQFWRADGVEAAV